MIASCYGRRPAWRSRPDYSKAVMPTGHIPRESGEPKHLLDDSENRELNSEYWLWEGASIR